MARKLKKFYKPHKKATKAQISASMRAYHVRRRQAAQANAALAEALAVGGVK